MDYQAIACIECGFVAFIPVQTDQELQRTHRTYYCINGHGQHYTKPEPPTPQEPRVVFREKKVLINEQVMEHTHRFSRGKKPQCKVCGLYKHMLKTDDEKA